MQVINKYGHMTSMSQPLRFRLLFLSLFKIRFPETPGENDLQECDYENKKAVKTDKYVDDFSCLA